jgi:hypothetical protein
VLEGKAVLQATVYRETERYKNSMDRADLDLVKFEERPRIGRKFGFLGTAETETGSCDRLTLLSLV